MGCAVGKTCKLISFFVLRTWQNEVDDVNCISSLGLQMHKMIAQVMIVLLLFCFVIIARGCRNYWSCELQCSAPRCSVIDFMKGRKKVFSFRKPIHQPTRNNNFSMGKFSAKVLQPEIGKAFASPSPYGRARVFSLGPATNPMSFSYVWKRHKIKREKREFFLF